ncbi:protein MAIN-LIKE 1-like [Cryptomeria japonica]|uniref:protein MAIN-LIKE 1-like n=1 Tax=Cryptomeria japonica TaxID=3369 RepID=UPI0027D9E66E|nr:protein MAIN-LIKE 1-like [Cryptomeria japonica]
MCHLVSELSQDAVRHIDACSLRHLLYMPDIMHNRGLLTTLAERWHNEYNTFHLPTGEISITLEDVYRILHIHFTGELVQYDYHDLRSIEACKEVFGDESIDGGEIRWEDMIMHYETLPVILASLIGGFIYPDRRSQGFVVGWGNILQSMMEHCTRYAWGI